MTLKLNRDLFHLKTSTNITLSERFASLDARRSLAIRNGGIQKPVAKAKTQSKTRAAYLEFVNRIEEREAIRVQGGGASVISPLRSPQQQQQQHQKTLAFSHTGLVGVGPARIGVGGAGRGGGGFIANHMITPKRVYTSHFLNNDAQHVSPRFNNNNVNWQFVNRMTSRGGGGGGGYYTNWNSAGGRGAGGGGRGPGYFNQQRGGGRGRGRGGAAGGPPGGGAGRQQANTEPPKSAMELDKELDTYMTSLSLSDRGGGAASTSSATTTKTTGGGAANAITIN